MPTSLSALLNLSGGSGQVGNRVKEYKTPGTYQFLVPSDCHIIYVTGCGAGQGGTISQLNSSNQYPPQKGGNGAFAVIDMPVIVTPNSTIMVYVPTGGVANINSETAIGSDLVVKDLLVLGGKDNLHGWLISNVGPGKGANAPAANTSVLRGRSYGPLEPHFPISMPSDNTSGVTIRDDGASNVNGALYSHGKFYFSPKNGKFTTFFNSNPCDQVAGGTYGPVPLGFELESHLPFTTDGVMYRGGFGGLNGSNTNIDGERLGFRNLNYGKGGGGANTATSGGGGGASLFGDGGNFGSTPSAGNFGSGGGGGSIYNNGAAGNGAPGFCVLRY